jgi:renal tumor antigen
MATLGSDFRVISKLGEGSFAEVFKVRSLRTGEYYAVKRLKKRYRRVDDINQLAEVASLRALQGHPNIVNLVDLTYDSTNGYVAMVFEVLECNVYEFITQHKRPFEEQTAILLVYQLLKAIAFMHSKSLFHRDIKPENCMVNTDTLVLKLCDFGSTRGPTSSAQYTEYVSTRWYRAPECILTSGSYGPEVDEWAVGCMLYELLTTRPLFPGKHELDQISRIHNVLGTPSRDLIQQFKRNPNQQMSYAFPQRHGQDFRKLLPRVSPHTIDLLCGLLTYDPHMRLTAADALAMDCFRELRRADAAWEATDRRTPFPVYFGRHASNDQIATENMSPPADRPDSDRNAAPIQETVAHPQPAYVLPSEVTLSDQQTVPDIGVSPAPPPRIAVPQPAAPPPATMPMPGPNPKPAIKPVQADLIGSRVLAAQRAKAYVDPIALRRAPKPGAYHGPTFHLRATKPPAYQRPRPELVQPRLPRFPV